MKEIKIYFLYLEVDEKPVYVGSTKQELRLRRENHLSDKRGNTLIKNWIKEQKSDSVGKHIKIKLIEHCSAKNRYKREAYWTKVLKTKLNTKEGVKHTEDHKKKVSEWMSKRVVSKKTLQKMSDSQNKKSVVIDSVKYASINEASDKTGISLGLISSVCSGKRNSKKYKIHYGE